MAVFEDTDRGTKLLEQDTLNFVIMGGRPTGTEMAGALPDMINLTMPAEYADLAVKHARDCKCFGRHHGFARRYQDRKRNLFDSVGAEDAEDAPRSRLGPEDGLRTGKEW